MLVTVSHKAPCLGECNPPQAILSEIYGPDGLGPTRSHCLLSRPLSGWYSGSGFLCSDGLNLNNPPLKGFIIQGYTTKPLHRNCGQYSQDASQVPPWKMELGIVRKSEWSLGWAPGTRGQELAYLIPEFSVANSEESKNSIFEHILIHHYEYLFDEVAGWNMLILMIDFIYKCFILNVYMYGLHLYPCPGPH